MVDAVSIQRRQARQDVVYENLTETLQNLVMRLPREGAALLTKPSIFS